MRKYRPKGVKYFAGIIGTAPEGLIMGYAIIKRQKPINNINTIKEAERYMLDNFFENVGKPQEISIISLTKL